MSKERLEKVKKDYKHGFPADVEWLIEQAGQNIERSVEIADLNWFLQNNMKSEDVSNVLGKSVIEAAKYVIEKQQADNKRYREALEFYGDKRNYEGANYWKIVNDGGRTARRELGK